MIMTATERLLFLVIHGQMPTLDDVNAAIREIETDARQAGYSEGWDAGRESGLDAAAMAAACGQY